MEENLISKKDLLAQTGISYGQLYRWKRKNIIPEDWFIKKSTFTGQETFFPKEKILERIEIILSMKDGISLDDIANMFVDKKSNKKYNIDILLEKEVIGKYTKEVFQNICEKDKEIEKSELLILSIIENFLINSTITLEELKNIANIIEENFNEIFNENGKIYLYRKLGIPFILATSDSTKIITDPNMVKIVEINVMKEISDISMKLV